MYLHYGQRMYGKCDVVPELFYVATFCFHINFVPLVPLGSHLVLGQSGKSYQTVRIPFSVKSLFYTWARAGLLVGSVVMWVIAIVVLSDTQPGVKGAAFAEAMPQLIIAVCLTLLFLLVMFYPVRVKPNYRRACELAALAKLNERGWAALNVQYDRHPLDRPGQEQSF